MIKPLKPLNITLLISNWLSVSMIFLIGEVVIRYGVFASLIVVITFVLAFLASTMFQRFTLYAYQSSMLLERIILGFWYLEIFILHFFISGILLESIFHVSLYTSIFFTAAAILAAGIIIACWEGLRPGIQNLKFLLISGLAIFLPTYIYLQKGLESVYHNLLHYHPRILHYDQQGILLLIFAAFFIFFTKFFIQRKILMKYIGPSYRKGIRKLIVAVFIFSTFILAFSTMTVVAITQNIEFKHANELLVLLIKKTSGPMTFQILSLVLYASTLLTLVETCSRFIKKGAGTSQWTLYALIIGTSLITVGAYHYTTLLFIYTVTGVTIGVFSVGAIIFMSLKNIGQKS
ncbi:Uncharacterised protein [Bacillus freudenreichii]|nr:Uncharacterised protein [Bacillus freudenreichii]